LQKTVRLGYVGAGRFSRSRLLPAFKDIPGVELVAVCNSTVESGQSVAQEFGFQRVTKEWQEVMAAPDIDAVVIGTLTPLHHDISIAALDADKHVLTLNGIASSLQEANDMFQKAQEKPDLVALVYPTSSYLAEDAFMRTLLEEGYVGRVLMVMDYWYSPAFRLANQFEVAHRWFGEHTSLLAYRKSFEVENPAVDQRGRPVRSEANLVVSELASGATITYLHSTVAEQAALTRFEVYGTEGSLFCYARGQARQSVYGVKSGETEAGPIEVPSQLQPAIEDPRSTSVERSFISAVRGEGPPSPAFSRFWDGVRLMEFAEVWRLSIERGGWCDLPMP
jgi:predicted dehydrogenase